MDTQLLTLVLATIGVTVLGAQQPARDTSRAPRLPTIVTTASRYASSAESLPRRMEVITRAQLDQTPALDVVDLLKKRATVDVVQYPGLLGGIGLRGFRPQVGTLQQRVLVLLDGRPSGLTNLSLLDVQDVERIEVLKGAASALYGSTAMGGVVNVVTRKRTGARQALVSLGGGSFGTSEVRVQGGGALFGGLDADVSVRRYDQRTDYDIGNGNVLRGVFGRDSARKSYPGATQPSRWVPDTIGDGVTRVFTSMTTTSGNVRVGGSVGARVRMDVRGEAFDAQDVPSPGDLYSAATPFPGNGRKNLRRAGGALELGGMLRGSTLLARAFTTDESSDYFDRPDSVRYVNFNTGARTTGFQLQGVSRIHGQQIVVGVDGTLQRASSRRWSAVNTEAGTYSPDNENRSLAAFGEVRLTAIDGRLVATVGARADRVTLKLLTTPLRPDIMAGDDDFTVTNPSAGLSYALRGGVRAHATVGRAFVAPDAFGRAGLTQAVTAGVASITFGNPTLRAEHAVTADVGVGVSRLNGALDFDATYFHTDVTDRIALARAAFATGSRPVLASGAAVSRVTTSVNAGEARIRGLEAAVRYDVGAALRHRWSLNLFANVTRIFDATQLTPSVRVNAAQFSGVANFSPASIFSGVIIGESTTSARIANVASSNWSVGVEWDSQSRLRVGALGRYVGTRMDDDFSDFSDVSDIEYPPFAVLDLTAGVRITRRLRADLQLVNVTDENYYEKRGYSLPGRAFRLSLATEFR
jgi:vitamin B12 transporter